MPHIEELYKEYGENRGEVIILTVAAPNLGSEGSEEEIISFLNDNNYNFPVVMDFGGEMMYKYDISGFPSTFIIDSNGYITKKVVGAMDRKSMDNIIKMGK